MFFEGPPVRTLGTLPEAEVLRLTEFINSRLGDKWVTRQIAVMRDARVLKALSPSQHDRLASEDENELFHELQDVVSRVLISSEDLVYLDVSLLPAGKKIDLHVDWSMMHVHSRRIHLPLVTDPRIKMAFVTQAGEAVSVHLQRGVFYEVNNLLPHAVSNPTELPRMHVLLDVMDEEIHEALLFKRKLISSALGSVINRCFSPEVLERVERSLCC